MYYEERLQNIVIMPQEFVIAHCISGDYVMGAGVAKVLCDTYAPLRPLTHTMYGGLSLDAKLGKTLRVNTGNRVIYNMVTKPFVYANARTMGEEKYLNNLYHCLIHLRQLMIQNGEMYLAMPKIACGLDRCNWSKVSVMIQNVFKDTAITVIICMWG